MEVVDAFCGAGGFSAGAMVAGCRVTMGIDSDPVPLKLWAANTGGRAVCATIGRDAVEWPEATIARQIVPEVGQNAIHCAWWENVPVTRDTYEGRSERGKALSKKFLHRSEVGEREKFSPHTFFFSGLYVSRVTRRGPPPKRLLAKTHLR